MPLNVNRKHSADAASMALHRRRENCRAVAAGSVSVTRCLGSDGASDAAAEQAYRMGINVIYYAFNEYHRLHFE